jgi:hypothetical protein
LFRGSLAGVRGHQRVIRVHFVSERAQTEMKVEEFEPLSPGRRSRSSSWTTRQTPLRPARPLWAGSAGVVPARARLVRGRGLNSSTFQLNLSHFRHRVHPQQPLIIHHAPHTPHKQPLNVPHIPQKALTMTRKVYERKPLVRGRSRRGRRMR